MRKIIFNGAAGLALALGATSAFAMGGGWTPPSASPYAILEPQTVAPPAVIEEPSPPVGQERHALRQGAKAHRHNTHHREGPSSQ